MFTETLENCVLADFTLTALKKKKEIHPSGPFKDFEIKIYLLSFTLWAATHCWSMSYFILS